MVVEWGLPEPLPPGATGFSVYVNGEFKMRVEGAKQKNVLLSDIPRHQVCAGGPCVCVRGGKCSRFVLVVRVCVLEEGSVSGLCWWSVCVC